MEKGFALIAALLAIWILTALGMLVFSVTIQDMRVSSRTLGERKAFSAAESGISWLTQNFPNPPNATNLANLVLPNNQVVSTSAGSDAGTRYTIAWPPAGWTPQNGPPVVPCAGYAMGGGETWGRQRFLAQVTGTNTGYHTASSQLHVQVDVGLGYGPVDVSTIYR